jgi:hypothetical protein
VQTSISGAIQLPSAHLLKCGGNLPREIKELPANTALIFFDHDMAIAKDTIAKSYIPNALYVTGFGEIRDALERPAN